LRSRYGHDEPLISSTDKATSAATPFRYLFYDPLLKSHLTLIKRSR